MNSFYKYIAVLSLIIPNTLLGQSNLKDSTKPLPYIMYCNDRKRNLEKPIRLDWVQKDKDIITDKLNKLPASGSTITEIKRLLPHYLDAKCNCGSNTEDLGYGLQSTLHTFYGGYGTYHIDALHFGDNVIKLKLIIESHKEIIEKHLFDVMQLPFDCINGQIAYEKTYNENVEKYQKDSGQLFLGSIDTLERRQWSIHYFTDVFTGGTFTIPYYISAGLGNRTFDHLRYFIVNKDYAALECILFSPSPTGRLFAARTLMYLKDKFGYLPGKDTDKRMKEVVKNARPISSGVISCWINKFEYDHYDIVKDFEQFLITE